MPTEKHRLIQIKSNLSKTVLTETRTAPRPFYRGMPGSDAPAAYPEWHGEVAANARRPAMSSGVVSAVGPFMIIICQ